MVSTRFMSTASNTSSEGSGQTLITGHPRSTRNNPSHIYTTGATTSNSRSAVPLQTSVLNLPQEVIEKILSYLTYKNVCCLRLVCHSMDRICGHVLNSTFQRLQSQMLQRFQCIKSKMPRRESARRNHHLACESDIIETLHMRLTLLQMSFGKHIERRHCCFFPGEILDEVFNILNYIKVTPNLARPYKVTDELFDLSTMAMEYFKERIEPDLPEIAYFGTDFLDFTASSNGKYLAVDSSPLSSEEVKEADLPSCSNLDNSSLLEPIPQSNMVLRKRIRKIKQGMKRYNSQLSLLRQDLRVCKRKTAEQQKQISEQQKQLAEQQKQTLEYVARLDEYDKKNEEISRKFSTLLQELNKCKTELQYWRSKSPSTHSFCIDCGNIIKPSVEELQVLVNQGVVLEGLSLNQPADCNFPPIIERNNSVEATVSAIEVNKKEDVKVEASSSGHSKTSKRKINEPKELYTSTPFSKKLRQEPKGRSKRVKM